MRRNPTLSFVLSFTLLVGVGEHVAALPRADHQAFPGRTAGASREDAERSLATAVALQSRERAGDLRRSVSAAEAALAIWRTLGDDAREADTLHVLARSRYLLSDLQASVRDYQSALTIRVSLHDRGGEAITRAYLASAHWALGQHAEALDEYEAAARIAASLGDFKTEAYAANGIGNLRFAQGDPQLAKQQYERALQVWRAAGDGAGEGIALSNLGEVYELTGERQLALEHYRQALPRLEAARQNRRAADTVHNIGRLYGAIGRTDQAVTYFTRALTLDRASGNRRSEARTRLLLAAAHLQNGAPASAFREYVHAWQLARQIADRDTEADALRGRAEYYLTRQRATPALRSAQRAYALHHALGNAHGETADLLVAAISLSALGRAEDARAAFDRDLALRVEFGDRVGEAETRHELARALAGTGQWSDARAQVESAIGIVESLRTQLTSDGFRRSYFATVQSYYRWYIDLLMRMHSERSTEGFDRLALEASERARARSLLDLLSAAGADATAGAPPELLRQRQAIQGALNVQAGRHFQLAATESSERARLDARIAALVAEYDEVDARIRRSSPQYTEIVATPLRVDQIQALLDAETTMVIYGAGEQRAYAWVLTRSTASVRALLAPARLRQLASAARQALGRDPLASLGSRQGVSDTAEALDALSDAVLEPLASLVRTPRLVIVASDALEYVPIGILPSPASLPRLQTTPSPALTANTAHGDSGKALEYEPLMMQREVSYLPSASALERLRARVESRAEGPASVAVFADPVFTADDPRLGRRGSGGRARAPVDVLDVAALGTIAGSPFLPRLAGTRAEAELLARLAPGDALVALDFDASRSHVLKAPLERYRIVHFATHAVIDDRHPELAGVLLSFLRSDGSPQDGFLRLHDVYALRLAADLVVLSACQTAVGPEVRGEGMVGLVRGFMSAGAARVVASLWKVDDAATAALMTEFYTALLRDGLSASAALRRAQMHLWQHPRWHAPFYWAAFQLQGDWR